GRVEAVFNGDFIVHQHRLDLDAVIVQHVGRHLEVQHVAGVVLDDVQYAGAAVRGLAAGQHLVGHRRGEHRTGTRGVEHAKADESAVQRLVAATAAGHQRHLALDRTAGPEDDLVLRVDGHQIPVRSFQPGQRLGDDVVRV